MSTEDDTPDPPAFALWFREGKGSPWAIVGTAATYGGVVMLIGIGDRHNGEWFPLIDGKHPNKCGAPDRPLRKPKPAALAAATASMWGPEL